MRASYGVFIVSIFGQNHHEVDKANYIMGPSLDAVSIMAFTPAADKAMTYYGPPFTTAWIQYAAKPKDWKLPTCVRIIL